MDTRIPVRRPWRLAVECILLGGLAWWSLSHAWHAFALASTNDSFGDRLGYQSAADHGWLSLEIWAGERPAIYPLFLKLTGAGFAQTDFSVTVQAQFVYAAIAWTSLAAALASTQRFPAIRALLFAAVLGIAGTEDVLGWSRAILSESVSLSGFALAAAGLVLALGPAPAWLGVPVALVGGFLFVGVRDANAWALPGGMVLLLVLAFVDRSRRSRALMLAAGALLLFWGCQASAAWQSRSSPPLMNVLAMRAFPFPEHAAFFFDHGMPNDGTVECMQGRRWWDCPGWRTDMRWTSWLSHDGRGVYGSWLLQRPVETLVAPIADASVAFDSHSCEYLNFPRPAWMRWLEAKLYWTGLGYAAAWGIALLGCLPFLRRSEGRRLWGPLALALLAYPIALLTWHGDVSEPIRHFLHPRVQGRLALFWTLATLLDLLISRLRGGKPVSEKC